MPPGLSRSRCSQKYSPESIDCYALEGGDATCRCWYATITHQFKFIVSRNTFKSITGIVWTGNERNHLEKGARSGSLSSLGSSGSRGEIEGGGNTSRAGSFVGRVGGIPGSAFASDAGGASGIGCRRGSSGSNGTAFGDPEVDDDPIMSTSAPPSSTKKSAQLAQFAQSQGAAAAGVVTPRKPMPKPAAKPTAKPAASTPPSPPLTSRPSYRDKRFEEVLGEEIVRLDELRKISWNGVPKVHRPAVWQLLVGYMPANKSRRAAAMERKRREYREAVPQYFDVPDAARSHQEQNILRQILVDVPRTCPDVPFFHQEKVRYTPSAKEALRQKASLEPSFFVSRFCVRRGIISPLIIISLCMTDSPSYAFRLHISFHHT